MSEIKVNKISPKQTCTTVTLGDSGDDFVVATGANLKTAAVKDTAGNVIVSRCGSNITIGSSGAAIALACGATQTGFGRTGTVDWDTTAKTALFTAVSGNGYFVNTTSGAITVTLPASPSAGDIVAIRDYAQTFAANNLTIGRNGQPIDGLTLDLVLNTNGAAVTLVYVDGTQGWKSVNSNETINAITYVAATGGTITCCGDYKIHTFTGPGTFTVTCRGSPGGSNSVEYLVVAGGGSGGGDDIGGGGGAGGFRFASPSLAPLCYPAKPLAGSALPVSTTAYPITVGGGGAGVNGAAQGNSGSNSIFSSITSTGGGGAGVGNSIPGSGTEHDGLPGGSGGGGGLYAGLAGTGNTPPVSPSQGNNGSASPYPSSVSGGGGGGATATGAIGTGNAGSNGGAGGGLPTAFGSNGVPCGSFRYYAGGGAGSGDCSPFGTGGLGGGGAGGPSGPGTPGNGTAGTTNTGGGGGGAGGRGATGNLGAAGGSGIVIIRYKFQ
jgi:hypothetical protein